jgi:hypothetical protein
MASVIMKLAVFKLRLTYFLLLSLGAGATSIFTTQKPLTIILLVLFTPVVFFSTSGTFTLSEVLSAQSPGNNILSPTLSSNTLVYPQDIISELQYWEQLSKLQPTHRDILINQYILTKLTNQSSAQTLLDSLFAVDPNFSLSELETNTQ